MKNKYNLLIVLGVITLALVGYLIINNYQIKNFPVQGISGLSKSDESKISNLVTERFFSNEILKGEVSALCNESNTKITLAVNSVAEGASGESIGARVVCNCGIDCGYSITCQLKKISNNWIIESESQMSLAQFSLNLINS